MTLTLSIENFDKLEDGGPTWIALNERGANIGRKRGMDWVLPDPDRHISSHHFDIEYRDGAYWLVDVSMNGTFLQGQGHRIQGPHRLTDGERIVVGHYVVKVSLPAPAAPAPAPAPRPEPVVPPSEMTWSIQSPPTGGGDAWGGSAPAPTTSAPQFAPQPGFSRPQGDGMSDFVPVQRPGGMPPAQPAPTPPPAAPPHHAPDPFSASGNTDLPHVNMPGPDPMHAPAPSPVPTPVAPQPASQPYTPPSGYGAPDLVAAFCEGAGLDPALARGVDGTALMRELGALARGSGEQVMALLRDRASTKNFVARGERTMTQATGNNPMKFASSTEEALVDMFLQPKSGYLAGSAAFEQALGDIRGHQMAVFMSIQPALAELMEGLSPDEIEDDTKGGRKALAGSRKARNWDEFVERWDAKAKVGDHGILSAFLAIYGRLYLEAQARRGDGD